MKLQNIQNNEIVYNIQKTFVRLYKACIAKSPCAGYNKDRNKSKKGGADHGKNRGYEFTEDVAGISEEAYNLPEDVYNDVIPSGVHDFCRFDREY